MADLEIYTTETAAVKTGFAPVTISEAVRRGELVGEMVGQTYAIMGDDLETWVESKKAKKAAPRGRTARFNFYGITATKKFYSQDEAAKCLGVSANYVSTRVKDGRIRAVKGKTSVVIYGEWLQEYIDSHSYPPEEEPTTEADGWRTDYEGLRNYDNKTVFITLRMIESDKRYVIVCKWNDELKQFEGRNGAEYPIFKVNDYGRQVLAWHAPLVPYMGE